jgi:hypothetical protein
MDSWGQDLVSAIAPAVVDKLTRMESELTKQAGLSTLSEVTKCYKPHTLWLVYLTAKSQVTGGSISDQNFRLNSLHALWFAGSFAFREVTVPVNRNNMIFLTERNLIMWLTVSLLNRNLIYGDIFWSVFFVWLSSVGENDSLFEGVKKSHIRKLCSLLFSYWCDANTIRSERKSIVLNSWRSRGDQAIWFSRIKATSFQPVSDKMRRWWCNYVLVP